MEKEKIKFYKKWWFWVIIILVILICIGSNSNNISTITSSNTTNETKEKVRENPYEAFNEYDGVYSFLLLDNNESGSTFDSVGILKIDNGICNIKYTFITKNAENIREYTGFAGKNKEEFYIAVQKGKSEKDDITYKCSLSGDKLVGELVSEFNLSGCSEKKLELTRINEANNVDEIYNQKLNEAKVKRKEETDRKAEEEKQTFIESCQTYTFEQLARNPETFKGANVKLTGEVVQVVEGVSSNSLRVNITKEGRYTTYYKDAIYVNYIPKEGEDKILEDDIITIYGTAQGDYSYTSTMGAKITLPFVDGKYITINK